ncbi:MAG: hypothetical protein ACOCWO_02820 [Candidatus Muiribacteriaceae bacterium]
MKKTLSVLLLITLTLCVLAKSGVVYTSLVIDARDIRLNRSMSPKVLNESGLEVYGTILNEKDLDYVMDNGVVSYIDSLANAKKHLSPRLGDNPLVIKAKGVVGKTGSNVVLSNSDSAKVLELNKKFRFLDNFKVIILLTPQND